MDFELQSKTLVTEPLQHLSIKLIIREVIKIR